MIFAEIVMLCFNYKFVDLVDAFDNAVLLLIRLQNGRWINNFELSIRDIDWR